MNHETDVLIIGAGLSGSLAALELARSGLQITLIASSKTLSGANSYLAQGGISYQAKKKQRERENFKKDILKAGGTLCFEKAVDQIVKLGPSYVEEILINRLKVPFNQDQDKKLLRTLEAAHSHPRILYHQDQTGKAIMTSLFDAVKKHPAICVKFSHTAIDLITLSSHSKRDSTCVGAYLFDQERRGVDRYFAKETILATGGVGELFLHTTNTSEARGDGIAIASRAGVKVVNIEYVQFHPTSLYPSRFLLSEALRGEGGRVLSQDFKPLVSKGHPQVNLATRDFLSCEIFKEMIRIGKPHLWLDISFKEEPFLKDRFPHIYAHCKKQGFDLSKEPLPIVPAAHYLCGGIAVDLTGKTTMHHLRAIGEVSCTGVHGANRLASTSLLEALVWAKTASADIVRFWTKKKPCFSDVEELQQRRGEGVDPSFIQKSWSIIKQTMWSNVGLIRNSKCLERGARVLKQLKWEIGFRYSNAQLTKELIDLRNGCESACLIAERAFKNRSSRGCHFVED